uniref:C2H2-type domain-containing protein n=1 Tax=Trichogramma kaykai TaxID=54128 RepID=A0ABD2WR47_9HYME
MSPVDWTKARMFFCKFCTFETPIYKKFNAHRDFHSNINKNVHCGFNRCKKIFSKSTHLKTHLIRSHGTSLKCKSLRNDSCRANEKGKFICTVQLCKREHDTYSDQLSHIKDHIRDKEEITCPYRTCTKKYSILPSFTSHLTKVHRNRSPEIDLSSEKVDGQIVNQNNSSDIIEDDYKDNGNDYEPREGDMSDTYDDLALREKLFFTNMAQFYLKLESELLVPASTVQYIVNEKYQMSQQGFDVVKSRLCDKLKKENISSEVINKIIDMIKEEDPMKKSKFIWYKL